MIHAGRFRIVINLPARVIDIYLKKGKICILKTEKTQAHYLQKN